MSEKEDYIWVDREGKRPVPRACPKCGRKCIRRGNRHHREVYCEGFIVAVRPHGMHFRVGRECDFRATVYGG